MLSQNEIAAVVQQVLSRMNGAPAAPSVPAANQAVPAPAPFSSASEAPIADITARDLKSFYAVDHPKDREAFMQLRDKTPARLGIGHCGSRHTTASMLRFLCDHAAAQDTVFSDVPKEFLKELNLPFYQTTCSDRDEFLTRPDKGRVFSDETIAKIKQNVPSGLDVVVYVADGLSSNAVLHNARDILPVITDGLKSYGVKCNDPFFVQYGRVGTMDHLGDALKPQVVCVLLGERPGLVTSQSMSAYIAYKPFIGISEGKRTVLSNIHAGGTPTVEAGAHIVGLIRLMLEKKVSGVDLVI